MIITTDRIKSVTFLGREGSDFCYIPILKNAHSWGEQFFKENANFSYTENFRDKRYIIFYRNPIQRWYSATAQWFASNLAKSDYILDPIMLKLIFSGVRLDYHADLQSEYLKGLRTSKCVFFYCDDENFEFNLNHFVKNVMGLEIPKKRIERINDSSKNSLKVSIINQLKNQVSKNPDILKNVEHFYWPDFNLMRHIEFYEPRLKNKFI